jgi:hypothetical protein
MSAKAGMPENGEDRRRRRWPAIAGGVSYQYNLACLNIEISISGQPLNESGSRIYRGVAVSTMFSLPGISRNVVLGLDMKEEGRTTSERSRLS